MRFVNLLHGKLVWLAAAGVLGVGTLITVAFWHSAGSQQQTDSQRTPAGQHEPLPPAGPNEQPGSPNPPKPANRLQLSQLLFSPDGKYLACLGDKLPKPERLEQDKPEDIAWAGVVPQPLAANSNPLRFSPDGKLLGWQNKEIYVWETIAGTDPILLAGHGPKVLQVAFSPDSTRIVAACNNSVKSWQVGTGMERLTIRGAPGWLWEPRPTSIAVSPDGQHIACATGDLHLILWDATSGAMTVPSAPRFLVPNLQSQIGPLSTDFLLVYSPDGKYIAVASDYQVKGECYLQVFESEPIKIRVPKENPYAGMKDQAEKGPVDESRTLETTALKGVFDKARTFLRSPKQPGWVNFFPSAMAFLPGNKFVALVGPNPYDNKLKDTDPGNINLRILSLPDGKPAESPLSLQGHSGAVKLLQFSPDGRFLASFGSDKTMRVWSTESWQEVATLRGQTRTVKALQFSADTKQLFTACWAGDRPAEVRLWDWEQGTSKLLRK